MQNKLTDPVSYICDTVHALDDRTADLSAWQQWVNQQIVTANARLESLRNMIQELPKQPQEPEIQSHESPTTQDTETQAQDVPAAPEEFQAGASQVGPEQGLTTSRRRHK